MPTDPDSDSALTPIGRIADLRALEHAHAGAPLMERAGAAALEDARRMLASRAGPVVVLAGPGNNGGDAFVVARLLRDAFFEVEVVFRGDPARLPPDAKAACDAYRAAGGTTVERSPVARPALVVDGLFGIGLSRPLAPDYAALVEWANASDAPILALDAPSGLDAESGNAFAPAIRADATATFIALKPGLLTGSGPAHCGAINVHALGLEDSIAALPGRRLDWRSLASALPAPLLRRDPGAHKGTFGTLAIVGGTPGMVGAPILAGRAAIRTGAGKTRIGFVGAHPAIDWLAPELMLSSASESLNADALVVGPGLGQTEGARATLARALACRVPLTLDADALNFIARDAALRDAVRSRSAPTLMTPHPAEAARLQSREVSAVQQDRLGTALELAREFNAEVVLKGAGSVLAHTDGTWDINTSGNPALASAGTGDVLSGILGAFLAQRIDPKTALRLAVCLHGAAADALVAQGAGPIGTAASELPDAARRLLNAARAT